MGSHQSVAAAMAASVSPTINPSVQEVTIKVKTGGRLHPFILGTEKLNKFTSEQRELLKKINVDLWSAGVDSIELQLALYGLENDFKEIKQSFQNPSVARMPFLVPDGDKRTLLRVDPFYWIGINMSTIKRIPFLEAFCSDRWTKEIPTLTSVNPWVVRLVDFVFASGRDFLSTKLTTMPLDTFCLGPSEVIRDLDFLNVECMAENLEKIEVQKVCGKIRASSRNSLVSATK